MAQCIKCFHYKNGMCLTTDTSIRDSFSKCEHACGDYIEVNGVVNKPVKDNGTIRKFETGATRDTSTDIVWAAGFYDGEGSVSCGSNNGNPYTRIQLSIGQKDYDEKISDTLIRFKNAVGYGNIYKKTCIGKEINQHQFLIAKASDVKKVINLLWPYLSNAKKKQAERALSLLKKGQECLKLKQLLKGD